jgi:hypothetical protein
VGPAASTTPNSSARACDAADRRRERVQARGDLAHGVVARLVAQQVGHFLLAFEGAEEQHDLFALRGRVAQRVRQHAAQAVQVRQPGEGIVVGQVGQAQLDLLAFRDVGEAVDDLDGLAVAGQARGQLGGGAGGAAAVADLGFQRVHAVARALRVQVRARGRAGRVEHVRVEPSLHGAFVPPGELQEGAVEQDDAARFVEHPQRRGQRIEDGFQVAEAVRHTASVSDRSRPVTITSG